MRHSPFTAVYNACVLYKNRPDLSPEHLDRTIQMMNDAVPDSIVTGYEYFIESMTLPDPDDLHVLAAAIRCGASVIVTFNEADFPRPALEPFGQSEQMWVSAAT